MKWLDDAVVGAPGPCSLLLRHAARPEIPEGGFGEELPITDEGRLQAEALGRRLVGTLARTVTSPVRRCVETTEAIRRGAAADCAIERDHRLGDPGVWVTDELAAGHQFLEHGPKGVVTRQIRGTPMPGMAPLADGVSRLVGLLVPEPTTDGLTVFVTHDAVIAPLLSVLLRTDDLTEVWPAFLEGALLSRADRMVQVVWRGQQYSRRWPGGRSCDLG